MTTEIESTHKNKSVFFPDVLKRLWEDNQGRDWSIYTEGPNPPFLGCARGGASEMNLDSNMAPYRPTIICEKCRFRIYFDQKRRNKNGVLIPLEWRTGLKHDCDYSEPKYC